MKASPRGGPQPIMPEPRRVPVPGSTVVIEIPVASLDSKVGGDALTLHVRCAACDRRLFDLTAPQPTTPRPGPGLMITRKCPMCGLLNDGQVTPVAGRRIFAPGVLVGPWSCECGQGLGHVDEIRGRISIFCRGCKGKASVTAADAIVAATQVNL